MIKDNIGQSLSGKAQFLFDWLCTAAVKNQRCPQNDAIQQELLRLSKGRSGNEQPIFDELRAGGFIRIEISGKNWRRIVILKGPYAGKATAEHERRFAPWRILDASGQHYPR